MNLKRKSMKCQVFIYCLCVVSTGKDGLCIWFDGFRDDFGDCMDNAACFHLSFPFCVSY